MVNYVLRVVAACLIVIACPVWAQEEEKKLGWADVAEFSYLATQGNAEASSLGLRNALTRVWDEAAFTFEVGAVRASTATISRSAIGDATNFRVDRRSESELTAANYFTRGRFDRELSERTFWFGGVGWDRNTFAGVQNRFNVTGGVGNSWFDNDQHKWRTDYGASWVHQEDVVVDPDVNENYVSARLTSDYWRKLNASVEYNNLVIVNENLSETGDFRLDMVNSIAVSMTGRIALKLSHQLLFDSRPSLELLPLFSASGSPVGVDVLSALEKTDSIFNVAIVISY